MQGEIGSRILWARELVEPNRAQFARDLGLDRSTVQKIEDGDRPPSVFNVIDFAHHLHVTTDYILIGSMRGVDGELAAALAAAHPELGQDPTFSPNTSDTATAPGKHRKPKKPRTKTA